LLDVELSGPARLTLAALSDFDGVTWRIGAPHRPAGPRLPEPTPPAGGTRVDARFTIRELGGRLAPAVDTPWRVRGIPFAFEPGSGSLLCVDALVPGTTYTVTSVAPRTGAGAATAGVPGGPEVSHLLRAGSPVPGELSALARSVAGGEVNPYRKAKNLERFLAGHYTYDIRAPGGHAYPNLRHFLLGSQRGTSEQFAAAYAVLGRLMNLPTRVVVGFTGPSGRGTVRGADALAWPEVLFAGVGWTPFDPMPDPGAAARPLGAYRPSAPPASASPSAPAVTPPMVTTPAVPSAVPVASRGGSAPGRWPAWTFPLPLVPLVVLALMTARWRRSQRRSRGGDPSDRVAGAWLELLDALRLAGRPAPAGLTVTEVAGWASRRAGLPPLAGLADAVNRVGFGSASLSDRDATAACDQAHAHITAQRRKASPWRRACWHLHPGPLWWRPAAPGRVRRPVSTRR
jgi:transglutaminase-like putative cysteine protease